MLIPVPGYSHLKIHVCGPPQLDHERPRPPHPPAPEERVTRLRARVLVLLEVFCGQRPPRQLSPLFYATAVTAQTRPLPRAPQAVRLLSLHLRARRSPEFCGTCEIAGECYGFTGWLDGEKVAGFRILR